MFNMNQHEHRDDCGGRALSKENILLFSSHSLCVANLILSIQIIYKELAFAVKRITSRSYNRSRRGWGKD